jgi:hypothetical protein
MSTQYLTGLENVASAIEDAAGTIAHAITPLDAMPGKDETGGTIHSLTEAVMGVTAGLCKIADSISDLAQAVRDSKS